MDQAERRRTDRTARLLKIEHLLYQNSNGLQVQRIAELCEVSKRTTYRDLEALQSKMGIPISEEGGKRGIVEGYVLPPIQLTIPEALNIFFSARLMLGYSHRYDPNLASIFLKLNSIVPPPLRDELQKTLDWLKKQPRNERYLRTLAFLAEAWILRRQIKITYRSLPAKKATERIVEPYFIQPVESGHSSYVIAYCHLAKSLRTFKIERIEDAQISSTPYTVPPDFNANEFLDTSWGIVVKGDVKIIKLKFKPDIARIIEETVWHSSQVLEPQNDGSMIMTLRVNHTVELRSWILGWGEKAEVLEPAELRDKIIETTKAMMGVYREK